MFKFSIRELFLITLVIGLALAWGIDHNRLVSKHQREIGETEKWLQSELMNNNKPFQLDPRSGRMVPPSK